MTNRSPATRGGWWRFFLAALAAALAGLLGAGTASAATLPKLETRVGASPVAAQTVVGVHESVSAGQRWGNAPPPAETAVATGVAAKTTTSLADEAAGLLGNADDVVVLGRQADTAVAQGWKGHVVLDTPNWSLELNDAFIRGAIDQGRSIYLASPLKGNLIQTSGRFAGQPTVYARELQMLREAGYTRVGDYMVP